MGKKSKEIIGKNVRKSMLTNPWQFIQEIAAEFPALEYTRTVDTYIMEDIKNNPVKINISRDGTNLVSANLLWLSKEESGKVKMYLDNKTMLYPTAENVKTAVYYPPGKSAAVINVEVHSKSPPCSVCSKPLEIFDEQVAAPCCGALSHFTHLQEWVNLRGNCGICSSPLALDANGNIILA